MNRAIIVSSADEYAEMAEQLLRLEGCSRISIISSGSEARRLALNDPEPDILLINAPLPDEFGQELAVTIAENTAAGIILICPSDISEDIADSISDSGVCVVPKPVNRQILSRSIRLMAAARSRMIGLKPESSDIMSRIEEMRVINRAKTTLMKYLGFTEPQAHKYIEKQAMNNRQTRREVAERVLETYEK